MKRALLSLLLLVAVGPVAAQVRPDLIETGSLIEDVNAGKLPPIDKRVPTDVAIATFDNVDAAIGQQGGELRILMNQTRDVRMMVVYGYARLVGYDRNFDLVPDILKSIDVERGRVFTLHLREGHRWSDGHPFTAEDFRYWWQDVVGHRQLSPLGAPKIMQVDGKPPRFEVINPTTVRFSWDQPNPYFLPALAAPSPLYIYRPAHYLRQFHDKYADKAALAEHVKRTSTRNWAQLHNRMDNQYRNDNPDLPSLEPWVAQTKPPADRFVFARNPFYHRVDSAGRQLPYIDRVVMSIADNRILPTKISTGDADLQSRGIGFNNYTFLRQASKRNDFDVRLWDMARGAQVALFPNLNVNDPVWRAVLRDVRFRRALSLAVNREEINKVVYFGLALEGNNTLLPKSPLFRPEDRSLWAKFDIAQANRLLDEMGLTQRDSRKVRLLPDGRPIEIVVETAGEDTEQTDVLELIHDSWMKVGVKLFTKPSQREVFRNRIFSGQTVMSVWSGIENALPTAHMSPEEFAPTSQQHLQWPKWGQFVETGGASGEAADDPAAQELLRLNTAWRQATTLEARRGIWRQMVEINADQVFSIGTVAGVKQPVVVSRKLRNVPVEGIHNWDPGSFFGIYKPETFWFADSAVRADAR
jgi:peptide/nickel transport system substrate-binding protein